jgi:hypothetical protein
VDVKKLKWFVVAALLLAGILAVAGCGSSGGSSGKSNTRSSTGTVSEADLGVPIYPGATRVDASTQATPQGGGANGGPPTGTPPGGQPPTGGQMQAPGSMPVQPSGSPPQAPGSAPSGTANPGQRNDTTLWTADPMASVTAWYKQKLSSKTDFSENTMQTPQQQSGSGAAPTVFTFTSGSTKKMVMIRQGTDSKGGTYITIGDAPAGAPTNPPSNQSTPTTTVQ